MKTTDINLVGFYLLNLTGSEPFLGCQRVNASVHLLGF